MSIALVQQVYEETRRLAIGGSGLAKDDFRLKKLVPQLEQSALKAPVFGQVAKAIEQLIFSKEKQVTSSLLDLSSLVLAILYTQGKTTSEGTLASIQTLEGSSVKNQLPSRVLKPIIEAIHNKVPNRGSFIDEAHKQGQLHDLRLVSYAIDQLDGSHFSYLMIEEVLPRYGKSLFPRVVAKTDIKGKHNDARRLKLLHVLDSQAARPIVLDALENGSRLVQVAAIECLGSSPDDLPILLRLAKAKSKEIRGPAIARLGSFDDDTVADVLLAAAKGDDYQDAEKPIQNSKNKRLVTELCTYLGELFNRLFSKITAKEKEQVLERLYYLMSTLWGRRDKVVIDLLNKMYDRRKDFEKIKNVYARLGTLLYLMAYSVDKGLRQRLVDDRQELPVRVYQATFAAGLCNLSSKAFYDAYAPLFVEPGKETFLTSNRRTVVEDFLIEHSYGSKKDISSEDNPVTGAKWDKRWLDTAIKVGSIKAACVFGDAKDAKLKKFLLRQLEDFPANDLPGDDRMRGVLCAIEFGYPEAAEIVVRFMAACETLAWDETHRYVQPVACKIPQLPTSSILVLEAMLPNLREEYVEEIYPYLEQLKSKNPSGVQSDTQTETSSDQGSSEQVQAAIDALSTKGPNRLDRIREAIEDGGFRDPQLIPYVIKALDDSSAEICNLMATSILPSYGDTIYAELAAKTDVKGKTADARRLKLLHAINPKLARSMVLDALEKGSKITRLAATECLGDFPEDLPYLLTQAKSKADDIRDAALARLGPYDDEEVTDVLLEAVKNKHSLSTMPSIRINKSLRFIEQFCEHIRTLANQAFKPKAGDLKCMELTDFMQALSGRSEPVVIDLLNWMYDLCQKDLEKITTKSSKFDIVSTLLHLMLQSNNKSLRQRLIDDRHMINAMLFESSFAAGALNLSTKAFYDAYAPLFVDPGKKVEGIDRRNAVDNLLSDPESCGCSFDQKSTGESLEDVSLAISRMTWDKRWFDTAIQAESALAAIAFGDSKNAKLKKLLSDRLDQLAKTKEPSYEWQKIVAAMIDFGFPEATDRTIQYFRGFAKSKDYTAVGKIHTIALRISKLPPSSIPALASALPQFDSSVTEIVSPQLQRLKRRSNVKS